MTDDTDSKKVRFIGIYEDPHLDEGVCNFRYRQNTPPDVLQLRNLESGDVREIRLLETISLGGWMTVEEARTYLDEEVDFSELDLMD
jgi:hypothetical protein